MSFSLDFHVQPSDGKKEERKVCMSFKSGYEGIEAFQNPKISAVFASEVIVVFRNNRCRKGSRYVQLVVSHKVRPAQGIARRASLRVKSKNRSFEKEEVREAIK